MSSTWTIPTVMDAASPASTTSTRTGMPRCLLHFVHLFIYRTLFSVFRVWSPSRIFFMISSLIVSWVNSEVSDFDLWWYQYEMFFCFLWLDKIRGSDRDWLELRCEYLHIIGFCLGTGVNRNERKRTFTKLSFLLLFIRSMAASSGSFQKGSRTWQTSSHFLIGCSSFGQTAGTHMKCSLPIPPGNPPTNPSVPQFMRQLLL